MLFSRIWIPEKGTGPCNREEFDTWVDRLPQTIPDAQVFINGSEETATLLEKAHPETVVFLVRVDSLDRFCEAYAKRIPEEMAFIQEHLAAGGIAVFEPYRKYTFDGMRYILKEME